MTSNQQEEHFIEAYQLTKFDEKLYKRSIDNFINRMKDIGIIPVKDVIQHCKVFSIPDFLGINFDKDAQLFFNATMATGELLCNILLFDKSLLVNANNNAKLDPKKTEYEKLNTACKQFTTGCVHFIKIVNLAFQIRGVELGATFTFDSYDKISEAIRFLTNVVLVQHLLVHSRAFRAFVEVIGNIFINSIMIQNKRNEKFEIVSNFIDHEKSSANPSEQTNNEYQTYLDFVRTVITLYNDPQLPLMLRDTEIITLATDFGIPSFFHSFVDFLASMIMTPELADYVFNYIMKALAEILSFKNFFGATFLHPLDLQTETERKKLSEKDALGMESVLRLLTSFFRQSHEYFDKMSKAINFEETHPNEEFKSYLTNSLIKFILSRVPASLKAECFNCLAAMDVDLWHVLLTSNILVYDENSTEYKGIISDIMDIEFNSKTPQASHFSIPQAFSNLIASMLQNKDFIPVDFPIYHNFLRKIILTNLNSSKWQFSNQDMKWEMLQNICKAWINLLNRKDFADFSDPLYRSAISDPNFIKDLTLLTNNEYCPVECLVEVYRLFLLLAWKENEFLSKAPSTSDPLTAGIVNKISRDSVSIIKMFKCFMSHFMRLQIISMELIEFIASASPIIVQVLLTKPDADSIRICDALIKADESEKIEDFLIEGSENKSHDEILKLLEKDKDGNIIDYNARCFLLEILINLGSTSFFVRHVCGFDQHDPPKSIRSTILKTGILTRICVKLCEEKTHQDYPIFVAKSIQLLLIECKNDLTINSTLDLLRSSLSPFFIKQLEFLSKKNSSKIAIGCFLQIMALENANSVQNGTESRGIIQNSFKKLMFPLQNTDKSSSRNVLFLQFIDRIEQDNESINILDGINDLTVAYLSNPSIIKLMNQYKQYWPSTWMQIIFSLLEKVPQLSDRRLSQKVVGTCSLIANEVLVEKKFGVINPEDNDLKKLFTSILEVTSLLFDFDHHDSRIPAYSLLNTVATSIKCNDEIRVILQEKEKMILDATLNDCRSEIPILRSISFSVIEALISFANPWAFLPFLEQAIATTEDDWTLFKTNSNAAAFSLSARCRMFSKFLTTLKSDVSLSTSKVSPSCKIIIDEGLIIKLSDKSFWRGLEILLNNSTGNEAQIQTAADILSLFSVISIAFNDSDDLRIQLNWFLKKLPSTIIDIEKTKLTPCSLKLYAAFFKLLSTIPNIEDLSQLDIYKRIPFIFRNFANEADWRKHLKEDKTIYDTTEIFNQAQSIVSDILMSGIFVLMKISEKRDIFKEPLFGDEWRTTDDQIQPGNQLLSLSIITSYLGMILKEIKESEANNIKSDEKIDDKNKMEPNQEDIMKQLNARKRGVASACLLLVWYHINRWSRSSVYTDNGQIKEQAKEFTKEPYINFTGSSSLDQLILKQLAQ